MIMMQRFRSFISEGKYPIWVRVTIASLVLRIRKLSIAIEREDDPKKQNQLIAQQNKLISYINGLGIGISSQDQVLLKRLKNVK